MVDIKYISKEEFEKSTSNAKPQRGDILFIRVGSNLGNPVIVNTDTSFCIFVSLGFLRLKPFFCKEFVKHWLNSSIFWQQMNAKIAGGAKQNLNTGWLKSFDISMPCIEEQEKIANILSKMDELINEKKALLNGWKQFKKGLLQQMFV